MHFTISFLPAMASLSSMKPGSSTVHVSEDIVYVNASAKRSGYANVAAKSDDGHDYVNADMELPAAHGNIYYLFSISASFIIFYIILLFFLLFINAHSCYGP
jgi:hypothetical protein